MIRKLEKKDLEQVIQIWLKGNIDAHPFVPEDYWQSNQKMVQEQLLQAEVYVLEEDDTIRGFIGVMDSYIAGIFVNQKFRSMGIGHQLLAYVKKRYPSLLLNVYQENKAAVAFYLREGFDISARGIDDETGNAEYTMRWGIYPVIKLRECSALKKETALWFSQKWDVPFEAYIDSIEDCIAQKTGIPQWYIIRDAHKQIIAGAGVIENDFHNRKDLSPNICALFVEKPFRNQGFARRILETIKKDMHAMGFEHLYLVTDHTTFYEKCGWHFLTMAENADGSPIRMYTAKTR